jgi:hypothetical protein
VAVKIEPTPRENVPDKGKTGAVRWVIEAKRSARLTWPVVAKWAADAKP